MSSHPPKKSYLEKPLNPADFDVARSFSSFGSFSSEVPEDNMINLKEEIYRVRVVDLKSKVVLPIDAFLNGMGIQESNVVPGGGSPSAKVEQLESLSCELVVLTRSGIGFVETPYAVTGGWEWMERAARGAAAELVVSSQCERSVAEFRSYKDAFLSDPEIIGSFTWTESCRESGGSVLSKSTLSLNPNWCPISEQRKRPREEMSSTGEESSKAAKVARMSGDADEKGPHEDLVVNGARYAVHIMRSVYRRHVYQLLVDGGELRLGYYDRAGVVYSETFRYKEDGSRFVLLLKRMAEMNRSEIGFLDHVCLDQAPAEEILAVLNSYAESDPGIREVIDEIGSGKQPYAMKFEEGTTAYLITTLGGYRHNGLIGRGTSVFLCCVFSPSHRGISALKVSWPQAKWDSEVEILAKARVVLLKVDADPDLKKLYGDRKLEDSLPSVIAGKDLDDLKKERSFRCVTEKYYEKFDQESNRVCRAIAMELLRPLYSVTRLDHFKKATQDIALGSYTNALHV